ncbi:hypothetical protein CJ178_31875 [Rhodococcus sp. ACPA4]|uniref:branched-chain amino acid ABC transporter permease n=1 Tax=Rhodococcus sp. ACPA4 TaxID=2028571 RepID=UPI000BB12F71|nr:branched-chain amino acid ABC transporter permease [Rhodococcus sp. ACPA4]PBC36018.1 hypothetical protein CJ178_31875 [Rhodococcus sp. ACPA4]
MTLIKDSDSPVVSDVPVRERRGTPLSVRLGVAMAVVVGGVLVAPNLSNHELYIGTTILVWALVASSLNISVGYAGQLNLAQGGFLALGAYIGVLGTGQWGWPGLLTLAVAAGSAGAIAAILGLFIFRAKGLHFALLTTGITIVVYNVLIAWSSVTGGAAGISTAGPIEDGGRIAPLTLLGLSIHTAEEWFLVMLIGLVLLVLALTFVNRHKQGLSWQAIRDNETLSASVGIDVAKGKRRAFVASAVLASLVGVLFGHWLGFITPGSFNFAEASFEPLAMVIIGGAGTLLGPIVGAIIVVGSPEIFRDLDSVSTLVYGAVLLLVVMLAPKGIVGLGKNLLTKAWNALRKERP